MNTMENKRDQSVFERLSAFNGKYKDAVSGTAAIILGIVMFVSAFGVKGVFGDQMVDSSFFPKMIGILFMITGAVLVVGAFREQKHSGADETVSALKAESIEDMQKLVGVQADKDALEADKNIADSKESRVKLWLTLLALLFYTVALKPLGFIISSVVFITAQATILTQKENRKKRLLAWFVTAVAVTVGVYYIFRYVLTLFLPVGILG